jgi:chromosome partitioning protein
MKNIAERHELSVLGVLLSFWNPRGKSNQAFLEVIEETFPGKLLKTKVRRDIRVSEATIHGKPVFEVAPSARATQDYCELAHEILERI